MDTKNIAIAYGNVQNFPNTAENTFDLKESASGSLLFDPMKDIGLPLPLPTEPDEWKDWYPRVLRHRVQMILETNQPGEKGEKARAREVARCRRSFVYEACTYGGIFEAREEEEDWDDLGEDDGGRGTNLPFVMYPFQIEGAYWIDERMRTRGPQGDGVIVKSRDMGLSNLAAFWTAHQWMWRTRFQARVLSRKEALVDRLNDPDSFFWKIEAYLMGLPPWLFKSAVGTTFDWKIHRTLFRFTNPVTQNLISGESTESNAGRGGRATVVFLDEAAFMDDFDRIWTALRASTRHRIAISTVSIEHGLAFYNLEQGKNQERPAILRIPYDQHPYHDAAWLAQEARRDSEEGVRREVLMDYFAGQGEYVYPETHAYTTGDYGYVPMGGQVYCCIDDGFDDYWAMVFLQYNRRTGQIRVLDAYANNHKPADFYATLLRHQPRSDFAERGWYGEKELALMRFIQELPPLVFVGDVHGANVEQLAGTSVWEHFYAEYGIVVNYSYEKRSFKDRRLATGLVLPQTFFNTTDGAEYVLESFQQHRFKKVREGKDQMVEYKEPLHSAASHPVSAFEYFATQLDVFRLTQKDGQGGIRWTGRRGKPTKDAHGQPSASARVPFAESTAPAHPYYRD